MFKNLIAGEWIDGPRASRNINPSDTRDVVGEFAQADAAQASQAIAAATSTSPPTTSSTTPLTSQNRVIMSFTGSLAAFWDTLRCHHWPRSNPNLDCAAYPRSHVEGPCRPTARCPRVVVVPPHADAGCHPCSTATRVADWPWVERTDCPP